MLRIAQSNMHGVLLVNSNLFVILAFLGCTTAQQNIKTDMQTHTVRIKIDKNQYKMYKRTQCNMHGVLFFNSNVLS